MSTILPLTCSQIWLSPLVDDPRPPPPHKFGLKNTDEDPDCIIFNVLHNITQTLLKLGQGASLE
jgi:hypothetical protein